MKNRRATKTVYKNHLFSVEEIHAKKGYIAYRVVKNDVAVILPFVDKTHILMERQLRLPVGKTLYEVPAGHVNKGEDIAVTANRELEEETGYKAKKLKLLTKYYISPGLVTTIEYVFVATNLVKGKISRDKDEEIIVEKISLSKAVELIRTGKIVDAKTMVAILCYLQFMKKS